MRKSDAQLIEKVRSGEVATTVVDLGDEPLTVSQDIQISRSLRLPREVYDALIKRAESAGVPWSVLVKQWITEKLATDDNADPDVEITHGIALITHGVNQIRAQRTAA
jgi:hypothetical protein